MITREQMQTIAEAVAERFMARRINPCIDKRVILARIAKKIMLAGDKIGATPAPQALYATLGERVFYGGYFVVEQARKEWVN